jgi:hypothetical protein
MAETRDNMNRVCRSRIISLMTLEAISVRQLIIAVHVAGLAVRRRMFPCQHKLRVAVIERGRQPGVGCMTRFAAMIQQRHDVIWICRSLVLHLVTWKAVRVDQLKVVVRMAVLALDCDVPPRQCELRCIMVKRSGPPGRRGVTLHACLWISLRLVIWIGRICKVGSMAIDTIHRQSCELIVDVTILAHDRLMCARQWKLRVIM